MNANTEFKLATGQTLSLVNSTQADFLEVTKLAGATNTTLLLRFAAMDGADTQIDASGYAMDVLKALATFVDGTNVEFLLLNVDSLIEERYVADPLQLGLVLSTYRIAVVEAGVTVGGYLMYNDPQGTFPGAQEVRTLDFTLEGGSKVSGNINVSTTDKSGSGLTQQYLDVITIHSKGTSPNTITGSIIGTNADVSTTVVEVENNVQKVVLDLQQQLNIEGDIVFTNRGTVAGQTATLTLTGAANASVQQLDVSDAEIGTLVVVQNGSGTLTVTGTSPALFDGTDTGIGGVANLETLTFTGTGTGNIKFGDADSTTSPWGITAENLSTINASGFAGGLDLGAIYYDYPGSGDNPGSFKVDNTELYIGASFGPVSLKYNYAVSDFFGVPGTRGAYYVLLSGAHDFGNGFGVNASVGYQGGLKNGDPGHSSCVTEIDGQVSCSITDYKLGGSYTLDGWVLGLAYVSTNRDLSLGTAAQRGRNIGNGTALLSVTKSF